MTVEIYKQDSEKTTKPNLSVGSLTDVLLRPLLPDLRKAGLPISPQEYALALDVLQNPDSPFNLRTIPGTLESDLSSALREHMRKICRLLWATTPEEQVVLDQTFDKHFRLTITSSSSDQKKFRPPPVPPERGKPTEEPIDEKVKKPMEPVSIIEPRWYGRISIMSPPGLDREQKESMTSSPEFQLQFHVSERQLIRPWLLARRLRRWGPKIELDLAATIAHYARTRRFVEPQFRSGLKNRMTLLVLVDYGGSMLPFRPLISTLLNYLWGLRGRFRQVRFYYFHDYPSPFLYQLPDEELYSRKKPDLVDPKLTKPSLINDVIPKLQYDGSMLIISDGGAANQTYEERRYHSFERLIREFYPVTPRLTWLNPLPNTRWPGTTAERIKDLLPMYAFDADGLNNMALVLSGGSRS